MDPSVYATIESLKSELQVTRRRLESKCEALRIMSKELDSCQSERDQFRMMAEQVQERYQALRKSLVHGEAKWAAGDEKRTKLTAQQLNSLLHESREANKTLQFEVEELKGKLAESQGDIRLLRDQLTRQRVGAQEEGGIATRQFPAHERENLVRQIEELQAKYQQLEHDLEQSLDEKEESVTERDVYKDKYERLNHELNYILKGDEKKIVDIDALVMENKFLQDRLKQMEEEKSLAMATVSKYKNLLERRKAKTPLPVGQLRTGPFVMTQKQVREMLEASSHMIPSAQALQDLQNLARSLLDSVNDKNLALSHQRKTNKILGSRLSELERKLRTLEVSGLWNLEGSATLERLRVECDEAMTAISAEEDDCNAPTGAEEEDDDPGTLAAVGDPTGVADVEVQLGEQTIFSLDSGEGVTNDSPVLLPTNGTVSSGNCEIPSPLSAADHSSPEQDKVHCGSPVCCSDENGMYIEDPPPSEITVNHSCDHQQQSPEAANDVAPSATDQSEFTPCSTLPDTFRTVITSTVKN